MSDTPAPAPVAEAANAVDTSTPVETQTDNQPEPEVEPWRKVKHRFKAMGEVMEVDYDELVKRAEKATGAEKRLAEAARKEKEIQQKIERIRTVDDFNEVVELMGGEDRARPLLEKFLYDKIKAEEEEARLSPAERDARKRAQEAERKAKDAEDQLNKLNETAAERTKAETQAKANEIINNEIEAAIAEAEKAGLSPEDVPEMVEELIKNMVLHLEYLEDCEEAGLPPTQAPLSPQDVLRRIQDRESKRVAKLVKKLSAKDLRALLSDDQLDGLRKSDLEALTQPSTQNRATIKKPKSDAPVDPFTQNTGTRKKPNTKDWFAAMDQRYRNGR